MTRCIFYCPRVNSSYFLDERPTAFRRAASAMKRFAFLSAMLCGLALTAPCYAGGYCAFAYSTHTGQFGYGYGENSRPQAERVALNGCGASDAQVVGWSHNDYLALALGDGTTWGCGVGSSRGAAEHNALALCPSKHAHIVKWVYAFN